MGRKFRKIIGREGVLRGATPQEAEEFFKRNQTREALVNAEATEQEKNPIDGGAK